MRGTVPAREALHRAINAYAKARSEERPVDYDRLGRLFEAIIDAAEAVLKSEQALKGAECYSAPLRSLVLGQLRIQQPVIRLNDCPRNVSDHRDIHCPAVRLAARDLLFQLREA